VLNPETAWKRYQSISSNLGIGTKDDPSLRYFNLHETPDAVEQGSYNRRWNKQTLRGLIDLGILEQHITWWRDIPPEDREKLDKLQEEDDIRAEIMRLKILRNLSESEFKKVWEDWKSQELGIQNVSLTNFLDTLRRNSSICEMLESVYADSEVVLRKFGQIATFLKVYAPCGQCPSCRKHDVKRPSFTAPVPVNRMSVYRTPSELDSLSEFAARIKGNVHLAVSCENSEINECLQLIKSHIDFHLVDGRIDVEKQVLGKWNDSLIDFVISSPILPTIIIHDGNITQRVVDTVSRRTYLSAATPILLVGPRSTAPSGFYQVSLDTLKMWTNP
jgi:hypothetical protein